MNSKFKIVGSSLGALALLTPAVAAALPVDAQAQEAADVVATAAEGTQSATQIFEVQGTFSYDQSTTTATQAIVEVFNKAATTLCAALPQYAVDAQGRILCIKSPGLTLSATVDELAENASEESYIIGCACSSNIAGGGAIMNAEVSGVSVASVAARAQA